MTLLWKTKDGRELDPHDMETNHIKNCINLLKRKGFVSPKTLSFYLTCSPPNGEGAYDCFERELDMVIDAPVAPILDVFEEVLEERNNLKTV